MRLALGLAAWVSPASIQAAATKVFAIQAASAQTLRIAVGAQVTSLDPHFYNISPNSAFSSMIYSSLLTLDRTGSLQPDLAESWHPINDQTWEFKLRRGVRFQNGTEFTADDVAFSLERARTFVANPGSFATYYYSVTAIEVVDPYTVRLHTSAPDPLLPNGLTQIRMLNRSTNAESKREDFSSGRTVVGTGPYRLVQAIPGDRMELERNDDYFGPKPEWQHVTYSIITNEAARTAALLARDVDLIDQVSTADVAKLRSDPHVRLAETNSLRLIYIAMDQVRADGSPFVTDKDGRKLDRNPFRDARVRRALFMAVDRVAEVDRVMEGVGLPTLQFMPPGTYGYTPDLQPGPADLPAARRLLAEAGYPQGFRVQLNGSNDRYPNDTRILQALAQMWSRLGLSVTVEAQPYSVFISRSTRREFSLFLGSWGSSTGESLTSMRSTVATPDAERGLGFVNRAAYSNKQLDDVLVAAMRELDNRKREALVQQASRILAEDAGIIPIHLQRNVWAMRPGLVFPARADEQTRAQDVRSAPPAPQ